MLLFIWVAVLCISLVLFFRHKYSRFSRYGVKNDTPLPIVGNMFRILLRYDHFADHLLNYYQKYPKERFIGRYEFMMPVLMIRDLELIKKITIKDFEHFIDHRPFVDEEADPLFGRNLVALKGDKWKDMRSTLSPAFTSSKMRTMVPFIQEVGDQMIETLKEKLQNSDGGGIDVDCKDLTTRYANDVIASCAFGLKVNSLAEEKNQFYTMGKAATTFNYWQLLKMLLFFSVPKLMKMFKVSIFSEDSKFFFRNLVMSTMKNREDNHIIRPDMIHLLMEAKKGNLLHEDKSSSDLDAGFATVEESSIGKKKVSRVWTDDDLTAQALLFFIAGFESISSMMCFAIHELALNLEAQDKLVEEIKETNAKNGGKLDYTSIQQMKYLDMVVSEVLRLWPAAIVLDRQCVKDYNLGKVNAEAKEDYIIRKGEGLHIPVWGFHRNPEYFPEPLKFDPERFSDENKDKIHPFAYMPFGLGPRNCIGSRFALCELKVQLYQLFQHMEVSPCTKTCIPARLSKSIINLALEGGHWYNIKVRK